jgi:hypothetical protein
MAIIDGGTIMPGLGPYALAGAPVAGTNEVQTITFGGTPTGGTFKLALNGVPTSDISWSSTNGTLVSNIDTALEALSQIGTSGVTTAVGTMTAGIGTITVTFAGGFVQKRIMPTLTVHTNALTGTAPTLAVAETTPGVNASFVDALAGATLIDTTNKKEYINTGGDGNPTWTVVGTQT